jgi:putative flippase GtrA
MKKLMLKYRAMFSEFCRYLVVGGGAFIVDFGTLFVCQEYLIPDWNGNGLYVSSTIAFIVGIIFNYIFSLVFVFRVNSDSKQGKTVKDILIFVVVGIVGLGLTDYGMFLGTDLLKINYLIVKILITGVVLIWNYGARKILIFNKGEIK